MLAVVLSLLLADPPPATGAAAAAFEALREAETQELSAPGDAPAPSPPAAPEAAPVEQADAAGPADELAIDEAASAENPAVMGEVAEPAEERLSDATEILFHAQEQIYEATHAGFRLLGVEVLPGQMVTAELEVGQGFAGDPINVPVLVVHGRRPGPVLCLTSAIHGDELNGVEVVRRLLFDLNADELAGTVIGVPIVNLMGFERSSRYLPDRRDLNRYFPGSARGSSASRLAHRLFSEVITRCSGLVDLHTGSFHRTNMPQIRADLRMPSVLQFSRGFGDTAVMQSAGPRGSLRRAATDIGIPAVTFELGEPLRLDVRAVRDGTRAIQNLMYQMGMLSRFRVFRRAQALYYASQWVRVPVGGLLIADVSLGQDVSPGQRLGIVIDPLSNQQRDLVSPVTGRVLGMALNQVVMPGFAAFHIGLQTTEERAASEAMTQSESTMDSANDPEVDSETGADSTLGDREDNDAG